VVEFTVVEGRLGVPVGDANHPERVSYVSRRDDTATTKSVAIYLQNEGFVAIPWSRFDLDSRTVLMPRWTTRVIAVNPLG
jgi:hypothetical protein